MEKITVEVNGKEVNLTEFPEKILRNAIMGMLKSLHGVEDIQSAVIKLKKEKKD
ncbi:MAG: hypothetical protein J7L66_03830 [Anaerolineaceae bacterium]|nr:hypothetical protein [Anaerolineaceae bacterium]